MGVYESESRLEEKLINQLIKQGYKKVQIDTVKDLERNFREQINEHNKFRTRRETIKR